MKKICFVVPNAYPVIANTGDDGFGGAEVKQVFVARALADIGYKVCFLTYDFGQSSDIVHNGIRVFRIVSRDAALKRGSFYRIVPFLWMALSRANADVYFKRGAGPNNGIIALFCRLYNKKFLFAAASSYDVDGKYLEQVSRRDAFLYKYSMRNSDKIIVQAEEFGMILKRKFGLESVFIRDGHSIPEKNLPCNEREYVIYIGGMRPVKRPELFIKLATMFPDTKFVMIGGALENVEYFEKIRNSAQMEMNIEFMGHLPREEISRYLERAIVLVNTSEREGLPNTVTEAWSYGVPVVGFSINPDNLLDGKLGFYCQNNFELMVKYINEIIVNKTLMFDMSINCRKYAVENHNINDTVGEYIKVIENV